jgi:putative tricarboxylic transport membrane protein
VFEGLILFGQSIARFSTPEIIFYALLSSLVGVIMGACPA